MEWQRVRAELQTVRLAQKPKMSQTRLGHLAGLSKSTVNRIENVYGEPDHVPDLNSVERLVRAMGLTLSGFFARLEPASPSQGSPNEENRSVPAERRALDELREFIVRLGDALNDAAAATYPDEPRSVPNPRAKRSARR
jgi:transcriptional regulator with XRE-family HTH domain